MPPRKKKIAKPGKSGPDQAVRSHLVALLKGGNAHVSFADVLLDFPGDKRGSFAAGLPHTAWQLFEHCRIAQWDILEFSRDSRHVSPDFPEGYWPSTPVPPDEAAWTKSVKAFEADLRAMISLVANPRTNLYAPLPWGSGQTVLREALLVADHNAYHLGQLVDLRRALKIWPNS